MKTEAEIRKSAFRKSRHSKTNLFMAIFNVIVGLIVVTQHTDYFIIAIIFWIFALRWVLDE